MYIPLGRSGTRGTWRSNSTNRHNKYDNNVTHNNNHMTTTTNDNNNNVHNDNITNHMMNYIHDYLNYQCVQLEQASE